MTLHPNEIAACYRGQRLTVGLSGGVDSVVLLHILKTRGCDVRAAHVDHALRPDSVDDARFASSVAASLKVPFASARLSIERGNSTHGRARSQRYAALARLNSELGGEAIAVGHHANDVQETRALQQARGAGPVGLAGPRRQAAWWGWPIVRPLLTATRHEIVAYADLHGLSWREDPSNSDRSYARSRVRETLAMEVSAIELSRARDDADALQTATSALLREAVWGPTNASITVTHLRDEEVTRRALLDIARALHGELPSRLVEDVWNAIGSKDERSRRFCGRRVVIDVTDDDVRVTATRGHGTKLLDGRTVPPVPLEPDRIYPWFDKTVVTASTPTAGGTWAMPGSLLAAIADRREVAGSPARERLRELRIPAPHRSLWPCILYGGECVAVVGDPTGGSSSPKAGMFVSIRDF